MTGSRQCSSRAVLVLGVYGSGSSAVAGVLSQLGVMMGEKLVPPSKANPKGHFEDAEFRELLYQYRHNRSVLAQIEAFINNRYATYPLWGVKEPAILEAIFEIAPILQGRAYKVIATNRDTEASVLSYKKKWPGSDLAAVRRQIRYLVSQRDQFLKEWSPDVLWVDFNELTEHPEKSVRSILQFVYGERPLVVETGAWPSDASIQSAIDSIDPSMNHRLENRPIEQRSVTKASYDIDPILRKWVNPYYLNPKTIERIRENSVCKPHFSYAVLDNFFNESVLEEYIEKHKRLKFCADDPKLPYDSYAVYGEKGKTIGSELFYHKPWHLLLAEYTGTPLEFAGEKTGVKLRVHAGDSKGFWIHTDRTTQKNASMAALMYLNKDWKESDGGMLQLWVRIDNAERIDNVDYPWQEYSDQRLEYLNERYFLTTDLVTSDGLQPAKLFLIDQITPEYNRIVVTDFIRDPGYHSITPSNGRVRYAVVQWLF